MKWRILLVDDEPDIRLIVRTTLEPEYEILEAHDGLDALEKIRRYEPDFVLMDVMMPLMDGFECCRAIRNDSKFGELPVMFLSALGGREDMKKGYGSGANLYLTKPFDPSRLRKNVDVFFQTTPPPRRHRRYTIDQIKQMEEMGHAPVAPGADEFIVEPPAPVSRSSNAQVPIQHNPASRSSAQVPLPAVASAPETPVTPRVMVVDDDHEVVDLIRMTMQGLVEVVAAYDGVEAIEKLVKYQPDILMIDITLPKMNGFQLTQSLRSNRAFARLPILMCSAKGQARDIAYAKRVGADDLLPKPFTPLDLMGKIKEMQKLPGYRVRPKTYAYEQIQEMEAVARKSDPFNENAESRKKAEVASNENRRELEKFLHNQGNKDALDRDAEPEKKKRRLFGFRSGE